VSRVTWRRIAVGVALGGVAFAVWYGYAPETLPATLRRPLAALGVDRGVALAFVGAVAGVLGLCYAWITEPDAETPIVGGANDGPERAVPVAGADLSTRYEREVESGGGAEDDPLRWRLRSVVVERHWHAQGGHEAAAAHVDRGEWTDDRYAAAFLTTSEAVDYPWYHRLYAWLYPGRAYEKRVTRALAAVEEACAEELSGYEAPSGPPESRLRTLLAALEGPS
jgi:hypothetical protein